jgi:hypothetical protein
MRKLYLVVPCLFAVAWFFLLSGQAEARTKVGRTAAELEKTQTWGEAPEDTAAAQGTTKEANTLASRKKRHGRGKAGEAGNEPGSEPVAEQSKRTLGASESMDKLFPVGTPTPEKDPLAREITEWIHDLGGESHQRQNAIERLSTVGTRTVPYLRQALKDPYKYRRVGALAVLANFRDKSVIPDIEHLLGDPASEVRVEAVKSLGEMKSKGSLSKLSERLWDRELRVRREAAMALGRLKTADARDALVSALETSEYMDVRQQAAQELSDFLGEEAVNALLKATRDSDIKLCAYAVHSLGEIGAVAARPRLEELSRHRDRFIREEAVDALKNLE